MTVSSSSIAVSADEFVHAGRNVSVLVRGGAVEHRARALHKEVSQVRITALADVPKARPAAGGVLARYEPDPGVRKRELPNLPAIPIYG